MLELPQITTQAENDEFSDMVAKNVKRLRNAKNNLG